MYEEDPPRSDGGLKGGLPVVVAEHEKKVRREIANSNERRRMQSINAGFQSLRTLLPHHEGEKLSKASILQQTAEYIYSLEQEKTRLLTQNVQLKRLLNLGSGGGGDEPLTSSKRRKENEKDEETALQLLRERQLRIELECKLRTLESELASSRSALAKVPISSGGGVFLKESPLRVQLEPVVKSSERIVSTDPLGHRSYIVTTNNSRQNLDSIVEAIRHLEGDHLFSSEELNEGPNQVVKEEIVDSVSSSEMESRSSSLIIDSSPSTTSSSLTVKSSSETPVTLAVPVSSNNIVILKKCQS